MTYNTSVSISKLTPGSNRDYVFSHVSKVFIEPARDEIIALYDETPGGQLFRIFSDSVNIDIGDKLVDGAKEYYVRGVSKYDSILGKHSEIIARLGL